jgi:acetyl esterase/lipase
MPMRLLVLQSTGEIADLEHRCARWAAASGVTVEVAPPAGTRELLERLRQADDSAADGVVLERPPPTDAAELAETVRAIDVPVVAVTPEYVADRSGPLDRACVRVIHGRGPSGVRWALAHLRARVAAPFRVWAYGDSPDQVGDLRIPTAVAEPAPLAVILHGGFWRDEWERDLMDAAAVDLTRRGWITWNVEYRRMGPSGGGWRATLDDARAVVAAIGDLPAPVDASRIVLLGHSAGAQLALYATARLQQSGADVAPALVAALAPLTDLIAAARDDVGWGSVTDFLGDPDRQPRRYGEASPAARLPIGVPQLLVHGLTDRHVPIVLTRAYKRMARAAGDDVEMIEIPDADHFRMIDPGDPAWTTLMSALRASHVFSA